MAGVCAFVATVPIVGTAHISPHANSLVWPAVPLPVSVQTYWNDCRLNEAVSCNILSGCGSRCQNEKQNENPQPGHVLDEHSNDWGHIYKNRFTFSSRASWPCRREPLALPPIWQPAR